MKRTLALTALGVLLGAGPVFAQNPPPRPEGLPPIQREAIFKDGVLVSKVLITDYTEEERTRTVKGPDGKDVVEKYKVAIPLTKIVEQKIDPKKASVQRADGKAISTAELAKLLEKSSMVFVAVGFEKVDAFYLQFLKADAIVIVPERPVVAVPIDPKP